MCNGFQVTELRFLLQHLRNVLSKLMLFLFALVDLRLMAVELFFDLATIVLVQVYNLLHIVNRSCSLLLLVRLKTNHALQVLKSDQVHFRLEHSLQILEVDLFCQHGFNVWLIYFAMQSLGH